MWNWTNNSDELENLRKMVIVDKTEKLVVTLECPRHLKFLDIS